MSGNTWIFFPQSLSLLFYPQIHVQGRIPGIVGDRGIYWNPWLSACSSESREPLSRSLESTSWQHLFLVTASIAVPDSIGSHLLPPPTRQPQFSKEAPRKEFATDWSTLKNQRRIGGMCCLFQET